MNWKLRLLPAVPTEALVSPSCKVCGLSMPLRLSLDAQAGGAGCVEVVEETRCLLPLLQDARLQIPVREVASGDSGESAVFRVDVPWNLVMHRGLLRDLSCRGVTGVRDLVSCPHEFAPPFSFEPIVVDSPLAKRKAECALLRSLRKVQDGWTSTYLNRYISLFITRWLTYLPISPNQLSVGILAVGLFGAYLASLGTYWTIVLGAFLFQAQSVLDGCDGELSRVTYRGSLLGEWFDTVGDDLTNYGFFGGLAYGLYGATGSVAYLVAGGVVVGCGVLTSAIEYRYLIRIGSGDLLKYPLGIGKAPGSVRRKKGVVGLVVDLVSPLFKRDSFVFLTFLGALVGLAGSFLFVFAVGALGIFVAVLGAEVRMFRERRGGRL